MCNSTYKIISINEAKSQGLKYYFTGKVCKHGHMSPRYTNSSKCTECVKQTTRTARGVPTDMSYIHNGYITGILVRLRRRAKRKGVDFNLTQSDIRNIPNTCPILGIKLFYTPGKRTNNTPSVDRVDNSKGYTKDNIRIISWAANRLKGEFDVKTIENLLQYMKGVI